MGMSEHGIKRPSYVTARVVDGAAASYLALSWVVLYEAERRFDSRRPFPIRHPLQIVTPLVPHRIAGRLL
jgi:hypothetical protein